MNTDPPPPETPAPAWPPAPRLSPPEAAPAARRTLTPLAWLDAVIGLAAGAALLGLAWLFTTLLPLESLAQSLGIFRSSESESGAKDAERAGMAYIALLVLLCAGPCFLLWRRSRVLGAMAAAAIAVPLAGAAYLIRLYLGGPHVLG